MKQAYNTEEIESFIRRRFSTDCDWCTGNCYYFSLILTDRFPLLEIVYLPIEGHFMARDPFTNLFYDFYGVHKIEEPWYDWEDLRVDDPLLRARLERDCLL